MKTVLRILALLGLLVVYAPGGSFNTGGVVTCPTSGAKRLATTSTKATWWLAQALSTNTGSIYFGGSNVTTSTGVYVTKGDSLSAPPHGNAAVYDLNQVWFACTANTDSLTFIYQQ
jgi:hypothetical protein